MTQRIPGFFLKDHVFEVPLDHSRPRGKNIRVYAREAASLENEKRDLPWLVFLQGGPGFPSPRPGLNPNGVLGRGLKDYRVLLLDQRGTGLSSRISFETLAALGSAQAQADYLAHFRADSIVKDLELIRRKLLGPGRKWTLAGQSFGGWISTTYLSFAPEGLEGVLILGGLPPLDDSPDDVYRALYKRVIGKNKLFHERYPGDAERIADIYRALRRKKRLLPGGDPMSVERFQQLGWCLGYSYGTEMLHYLVEDAFDSVGGKPELSYVFGRGLENALPFDTNPIYSLIHEQIYCQGTASRWSAQRLLKEFPQFSASAPAPLFTGEMIYPWMFEQYKALKPLRKAAELLAERRDWPSLYDPRRLEKNEVPVAAAVYYDDMYVDLGLSEATARRIKGIKLWVTNQYEHDGIRTKGDEVVDKLIALLKGNAFHHASTIG